MTGLRVAKFVLTAVAGLAIPIVGPASAAADFYRGKTVTIIVSTGPGGGYDLYARTLSQHIGNHIPGNPNFILQFMPGAGGVKAANYVYTVAPKDGSVIALLSNGLPLVQLLKGNVRYDVAKFNFIGRAAAMNAMTMISSNAPVKTLEAIRTTETVFGSTGKGQQSDLHPHALKNVLGFSKIKVVCCYKGSAAVNLALEKGEVHAHSSAWSSWKTRGAALIQEKKIIPLLEHGIERSPDNPGVPLALDLARNELERDVLTLISADAAVGRAFGAPPGVPADIMTLLRSAFMKTMSDAAFVAEAKKRKMELWPLNGEQLQKLVVRVMSSKPEVIAAAKAALEF